MTWAVALEGRRDRSGILFYVDDLDEAESLAQELRQRGQHVVVRESRASGIPLGARGGQVAYR